MPLAAAHSPQAMEVAGEPLRVPLLDQGVAVGVGGGVVGLSGAAEVPAAEEKSTNMARGRSCGRPVEVGGRSALAAQHVLEVRRV